MAEHDIYEWIDTTYHGFNNLEEFNEDEYYPDPTVRPPLPGQSNHDEFFLSILL